MKTQKSSSSKDLHQLIDLLKKESEMLRKEITSLQENNKILNKQIEILKTSNNILNGKNINPDSESDTTKSKLQLYSEQEEDTIFINDNLNLTEV